MNTPEPAPVAAEPAPRWGHGEVGLWLIGARGSVGTTAAVGALALAARLAPAVGCTTEGPALHGVPLPGFDELVLGGHDVSETPLPEKAAALAASGMLPAALVDAVRAGLELADGEIRPGYRPGVPGVSQLDAMRRLRDDILSFRDRYGLARVVVVDVSSTEPLPADRPEFHDEELLFAALEDPDAQVLPASALAALAAIESDSAYACFTPSAGMTIPAIRARAEARIPFAGQDGKTGETLLRTVLAPMFTARGMRVRSWAGTNLLGGGDGATLADPEAVRSKLASKNRGLHRLLGDDVVAPLHIDNVPDLGDVKTAWDHVSAEGFLGSRVTLQTTWSAHDSMLAAPLVLDLARLLALADVAGERGPVPALGVFFKDPWGSDVHAFADQATALSAWASETGMRVAPAAPGLPIGAAR